MEYLSMGIVYLMELLITVSFADRLMKKKIKTPLIYLFSLPAFVVGYAFYFAFEKIAINTIISFLIYMFVMLIGYEGKLLNKSLYALYLSILGWVSEALLLIPVFKTYSIIITATSNETSMMFVSIIIKLVHFVLSQLLVFIVRPKAISRNKKFIPLFAYPVFTTCMFLVLAELFNEYKVSMNYYWALLAFAVVVAFSSIMIFSYYQHLEETDEKVKTLEKEKQFVELNNSYMQVLEHQNNELQMVFHDTKHHFMAIEDMDNVEDVKEYIHKIMPVMENNNNVSVSSNKMLNLLLNKYIVICRSKGIKFTYDVKTVNLDYIDDTELSILICNILDNAIEAAEKSKNKTINMSVKHVNKMDLLSVDNSCDIEPNHKNGKLITSKSDKNSHGYGTKIIEKHSKKNNGQMEWFYDNEEHIFHLNILFQR